MGYLRSKEFVLSGSIGVALALTFLMVPTLFPGIVAATSGACDEPPGTALPVLSDDQSGADRAIAYTASPLDILDVCVDVGDVRIESHDGSDIQIDITVSSTGRGAADQVRDTGFALAQDGDTLRLAQTRVSRASWWFGGNGADVQVLVKVPRDHPMAFDVRLDVGDIVGRSLDGRSDHAWRIDVGDIDVQYATLGPGTVRAVVDVGDVRLQVPPEPGYHLDAATDVGRITNGLAGTHLLQKDEDPAGDHIVAETEGYTEADTQVVLHVRIDVGDGRVTVPP